MNERIRELAEQAENYAYSAVIGGEECQEAYTKKFAELLARECARIIMNGGYWTDILGNRKNASPDEIAQMIKEHFGVKE